MFDKRKDSQNSPPKAEPTSAPVNNPDKSFTSRSTAMIGPTIQVKGTITGNENLVIEGKVDGAVDLPQHDLTIGESGQVVANLSAKTIKVDGQVTGDITGAEKVIISKSGKVQGNLVAPRVSLEDGAKFKGSIDMDPGDKQSAAPSLPKSSAKPDLSPREVKQEAS